MRNVISTNYFFVKDASLPPNKVIAEFEDGNLKDTQHVFSDGEDLQTIVEKLDKLLRGDVVFTDEVKLRMNQFNPIYQAYEAGRLEV